MQSPLRLITASVRLWIVSTNFVKYSDVKLFHITSNFAFKWGIVLTAAMRNAFFISYHNVSIGDKSGLLEGHGNNEILCSSSHFWPYGKWSCWKIKSPFANRNVSQDGNNSCSEISLYFSAVTMLSMKSSRLTLCEHMQRQSIKLAGNLPVFSNSLCEKLLSVVV